MLGSGGWGKHRTVSRRGHSNSRGCEGGCVWGAWVAGAGVIGCGGTSLSRRALVISYYY